MSALVKASHNPFNVNLSPAASGFIASDITAFATPWAWSVIMYAGSINLPYNITPIRGVDWNSTWGGEGLNPTQSTSFTEIGKGFVSR